MNIYTRDLKKQTSQKQNRQICSLVPSRVLFVWCVCVMFYYETHWGINVTMMLSIIQSLPPLAVWEAGKEYHPMGTNESDIGTRWVAPCHRWEAPCHRWEAPCPRANPWPNPRVWPPSYTSNRACLELEGHSKFTSSLGTRLIEGVMMMVYWGRGEEEGEKASWRGRHLEILK